jgi:hypothetical protein
MPLPITIPNTFANATNNIPLAQLDSNFTVVANGVNGIGNGANTLSNVSVSGGSITNVGITSLTAPLDVVSGGTGLSSPGASGNVLVSNGTVWQSTATSGLNTAVQGTYKNLKVRVTGNTICNVSCDQIVLYNGTLYSTQKTVSVSISTGTTGANGIESGTSLTAATWYYVYVIYNGTTVAGLLSSSSTTPTLPSTYTYYARVGCVRTLAASTSLNGILQYSNQARYMVGTAGTTAMPQMASGATSSYPAWTAVSINNYVPPTASTIYFTVFYSSAGNSLFFAPNNSYGTGGISTNPSPFGIVTAPGTGLSSYQIQFLLESTNIYWASNEATASLWCYGWADNL